MLDHLVTRRVKAVGLVIAAVALSACSSVRPWQNLPRSVDATTSQGGAEGTQQARSTSIVAAVTLSGGGARAAAFGLGVLQGLKATRFVWEGRATTLLDEVALVSGVSGGSVLAAYFAAFGDETLARFENEFLLADFELGLLGRALSPSTLYSLTSPWFGRSNVLAERLDVLYRGRTFGDLRARPRGPDLLVTATDLTTGAPFEFTTEQFGLICSDLASVPLAYSVAASSAVPILLTPVTLRNFAGQCAGPAPNTVHAGEDNFRARMLQRSWQSYLDARDRPFVHLVDGGLSDNLGVRALLDRLMASGSIKEGFRDAAPGSIRRIILIAVNSERDLAERIDHSDRVPSTGQVVDALVFGAGSRETHVTMAILGDDLKRWSSELAQERGALGSPFAEDAEIHVVSVSLRDVPDRSSRRELLQVPTAFTIDASDVHRLEHAGREALRASVPFQNLLRSLDAVPVD
jgi:NTE family protein